MSCHVAAPCANTHASKLHVAYVRQGGVWGHSVLPTRRPSVGDRATRARSTFVRVQPRAGTGTEPQTHASHNRVWSQLSPGLIQAASSSPSPPTVAAIERRLEALTGWQRHLSRGTLPQPGELTWPCAELQERLIPCLSRLDLPRFARRHPGVLSTLLRRIVDMAHDMELGEQEEAPLPSHQERSCCQDSNTQEPSSSDAPEPVAQDEDSAPEASSPPSASSPPPSAPPTTPPTPARDLAEELVAALQREWQPSLETLDMADGEPALPDALQTFDPGASLWRDSGWRLLADVQRRVRSVRGLRSFLEELGRGGVMGPMRRGRTRRASSKAPSRGVAASPAVPSETLGVRRGGELSLVLPAELSLRVLARRGIRLDGQGLVESPDFSLSTAANRGAARLFAARRMERALAVYARAGWAPQEPSLVDRRQSARPAARGGPVLVLVDTSGSMRGEREVVAKGATLEAVRAGVRAHRDVLVLSFSGKGQLAVWSCLSSRKKTSKNSRMTGRPAVSSPPSSASPLEMQGASTALESVIDFLKMSFDSSTSVEDALVAAAELVARHALAEADLLLVSDGEWPEPEVGALEALEGAREKWGVQVAGLLVGGGGAGGMRRVCDRLDAIVGGKLLNLA